MSNLTLIIGNKNYSSWSLRPWLFMAHYNMEFIEKRIPLFTPSTEQELAQYNSDFKVPVLHDQDKDLTVWDSLAIMEYLSENYLQGKGWPEDVNQRAMARSVSAEMHSSFSHVRNEFPMNCRRKFTHIKPTKDAQREIQRISELWSRCQDQQSNSGPWLFDEFSIADAMFAPIAVRFAGYQITLSDSAQAYVETMLNHPAVQLWVKAGKLESEVIDEDEIEL